MSTYSKRLRIHPNILIEYIFDEKNIKSEDYYILTNLKEKSKDFYSIKGINSINNSIFMIDPLLNKYSDTNIDNFNFLKYQMYFSPLVNYDKVKIYFSNGYDFDDYLGFFINIYTTGYNNETKYSFINFKYLKSNTDVLKIMDLNNPFYYDEKFWVRSIELEFPSINSVSNQRLTGNIKEPLPDSINKNLSYGEGISNNNPIFIDFSLVSSRQITFNIPYYYLSDINTISLPQYPEYSELGIEIKESDQGDFFEIYGTYMGSNENMDEFAYNEEIKGSKIRLDYIVNLYEENILTTSETRTISDNFTQKILYRPVIQFSNTTALIQVELRVINLIDNSYTSKYGSIGITKNINKYGLRLTRLNLNNGTINPSIFNLKVNNYVSYNGNIDNSGVIDVVRVPYPMMIDKYNILLKSSNSSDNNYIPNGLLELLINSFDNVIEFNIAQSINTNNEPNPYDISKISNNSTLKLVFKSDSEKLEKEPLYEANNNYELGKIYYKIEENDYKILKKIYNKGYDNFYLVVSSTNSNTQLYSGKFLFYEDIEFIREEQSTQTSTGLTETNFETDINTENVDSVNNNIDSTVSNNNAFIKENMPEYSTDVNVNKNFYNAIVYVRFQQNIERMRLYCTNNNIKPKIEYGNLFYFERLYVTRVDDLKLQDFIESVFQLELGAGMIPIVRKQIDNTLQVIREPVDSSTSPKPQITPRPVIDLANNDSNQVIHGAPRAPLSNDIGSTWWTRDIDHQAF